MNIAIVDDHALLCNSLKGSLENEFAHASIRTFTRAKSFLANNFHQWDPEIVISDVLMPEMDGLEMLKEYSTFRKGAKFIFLSASVDISVVKQSIKLGAAGFLNKESELEELVLAIKEVQQGRQFISPSIKEGLLKQLFFNKELRDFQLSNRENEVLEKLCEGLTPKEIASALSISLNTIQLHNTAILRKFNMNRTVDVITFSIKNNFYKKK